MKPENGYIAYILNPKAGSSSSKLTVHQFASYLREKGYTVKMEETTSLEDACELATDAAVDYNCAMVIAAGGDGTIREVAHGLEGSDKPLMIVPCGTENLLANELGIDDRFKTLVKTFEDRQIKVLDLGSVNGRCFTSVVGLDFDGQIIKLVSEQREGHINHLDYFWPIWQTFWRHKFPRVKVEIDGEEVFDDVGMVFVGNISRYALGLQILHYADFGDGLLDLCIYKCNSRLHLLKHSALTALKQHADGKDVIYRQGKRILVSSEQPELRTEIDGDPGPGLPLEIKVLPEAVKVIMPVGAKPAGIRTRFKRIFK